jgi:PhnB protein
MQLDTYLFFKGNCAEAFRFYERILGGKLEFMITYAAAPAGMPVKPEWRDKVMHARLAIGNSFLLGSDPPAEMWQESKGFALTLKVDSVEEAERRFNALAEKGTITAPLSETFWALKFGMLVDRFGVSWMVNCERPNFEHPTNT